MARGGWSARRRRVRDASVRLRSRGDRLIRAHDVRTRFSAFEQQWPSLSVLLWLMSLCLSPALRPVRSAAPSPARLRSSRALRSRFVPRAGEPGEGVQRCASAFRRSARSRSRILCARTLTPPVSLRRGQGCCWRGRHLHQSRLADRTAAQLGRRVRGGAPAALGRASSAGSGSPAPAHAQGVPRADAKPDDVADLLGASPSAAERHE